MSKEVHLIYIGIFVSITSIVFIGLALQGISYYRVSLEERFYHPDHNRLKPSGYIGHSLGIAGSLFILIGVGSYMARKRYRSLSRFGLLKYWLEFHIFMCILGTILVVFHTAFKVGGLAAVSFWSMVTVFMSGFAGRVIYLQIPRTMEGRELDLKEVRELRNDVVEKIKENRITGSGYSQIISLVKDDIRLGKTIERLETMKNLFRYWHVFHLPFALLMLVFMILHVIVTVALGYRWIF